MCALAVAHRCWFVHEPTSRVLKGQPMSRVLRPDVTCTPPGSVPVTYNPPVIRRVWVIVSSRG
jgi:hypothetical protein